jgi:hypothetical protein
VLRRKSKKQFENKNLERNCALKLFKAHCAATMKAKNASLHKKILSAKNASATVLINRC